MTCCHVKESRALINVVFRIWRAFDRGLYAFFKEYIFIPICAPTFSTTRKIFGVLVSYGFVLLWHGMHHHNVVSRMTAIVEDATQLHSEEYS